MSYRTLRHLCGTYNCVIVFFFFFQAEDGIRDLTVTGVQTCALPISHSCLFVAVLVVGAAGHLGDVGERAIMVVVEQDAWFRVHSHKNIRPAVVIKIVRDRGDRISGTRLQYPGLLGDIRKSAVPIVVKKNVGISWKATGTEHDRYPFPLA